MLATQLGRARKSQEKLLGIKSGKQRHAEFVQLALFPMISENELKHIESQKFEAASLKI